LELYEQNMKLSEAFYAPLQCMEICFRNYLHQQMCAAYGEDWFNSSIVPLETDGKRAVGDAYDALKEKEGIKPSDLVAALRLGFWVSLLGPRYDNSLWRKALFRAFLARGGQKRSVVHQRFNALRRFRNRVAHHEPIFQRPLLQLHGEIVEAIEWMSPETADWAGEHSRVLNVLGAS
jgi:hypothetical protein